MRLNCRPAVSAEWLPGLRLIRRASTSADATLETAAFIRVGSRAVHSAPVRKCADSGAGDPSLLPARSRAAARRVGPKSARRTPDQLQTGMRTERPVRTWTAVPSPSLRLECRPAADFGVPRPAFMNAPRKERKRARVGFAHLRSGPVRTYARGADGASRFERQLREAEVRQFTCELGLGPRALSLEP